MKAFIFDMDGVIIDSEPLHTYAKVQTFKEFGFSVDASECVRYMGRPTRDMFREIAAREQKVIDIDEMTAYKHRMFFDILENDTTLKPISGVQELLCELHSRGVALALASSSRRRVGELVLKRFGFRQYFASVLFGSDLPKAKPDPMIYQLSAERLGVAADACVVLEDTAAGVLAAKRAGMYVIGYRNLHSGYQDLHLADEVVEKIADIHLETHFSQKAAV